MANQSHRRSDPAFFHDQSTHALIEELSNTDALTIFAGAGISQDRGSPAWDELVELLLAGQLAGRDKTIDSKQALKAAQAYSRSAGPLAAASAVRHLYWAGHKRFTESALMEAIADDIHSHLYPASGWAPGGALAEAIVRLAVVWASLGRDVAIITTNYDSNLEEFAGDEGAVAVANAHELVLEALVSNDQVPANVIPIYHLHGFIPFEGDARGNLAFSEAGLALGQETVGVEAPSIDWRAKILEERLSTSTTVFVGTTMRDPTVSRSLIQTRGLAEEHARYAIFPIQGDSWSGADHQADAGADQALRARLEHLEVEAVRPDFFGQVAQLFSEVVHCTVTCAGKYSDASIEDERYGRRLIRWWDAWQRNLKRVPPHDHQDACQRELEKAKAAVLHSLKAARPVGQERLKLELWVRTNPKSHRHLELWGSSEVANRARTGHVSEIQNDSDYAAVQALCQGFTKLDSLDESRSSRWRSYFSVPIVLSGPPWAELPVGVVNLMSTKPVDKSLLASLGDPNVGREVRDVLKEVGTLILNPEPDGSRDWLQPEGSALDLS